MGIEPTLSAWEAEVLPSGNPAVRKNTTKPTLTFAARMVRSGRLPPYAVQVECSFWTLGESAVHDPKRSFAQKCFDVCFERDTGRTTSW